MHLWQALSIPGRARSVHWRGDENLHGWKIAAEVQQDAANLLQHWVDPVGNGGRAVRAGDEVGQASNDANGHVLLHLLQRPRKDGKMTAWQNLGSLQTRMGTDTGLVNVTVNVRVTKESESTNLRAGSHFAKKNVLKK